jgi:hypothetical protein
LLNADRPTYPWPPKQRSRLSQQPDALQAWQRATGYGRSLAETAVGRYKAIIGPKLRARLLPAQQGEAAEVLNRMIRVAKPVSTRVA